MAASPLAYSAPSTLTLSNDALEAGFDVSAGRLHLARVRNLVSGQSCTPGPDVFTLELAGGPRIRSSECALVRQPKIGPIDGDPHAARSGDRRAGRQLSASWSDQAAGVTVDWRAMLLNGTRYLRQEIVIKAVGRDVGVREIVLWDCDLRGVKIVGSVKGSPACVDDFFLGFEHPLSISTTEGSRLRSSLTRKLPIREGQSVTCSSVIGSTAPNQMRRGFLAYIEDQRAHPYRTFLHYNSWYDIGYFSKYNEAAALDRIRTLNLELSQKRHVPLDSYMFDDGWDNSSSLWNFHSGFPQGFNNLRTAAESQGSGIGVWLSPWGGYGQPKKDRILQGRADGYEIVDGGFALSGPKYYRRFHEICVKMADQFGVNQFKFDGTGNADRVVPGSAFDSDFDAAISLIADLRARKPDLYINLTTGTYPSPFWLRFADSIWRGGEDHDFAGVGTWRQRWITYRDAMTYRHNVTAGPLFPLNSMMLHGLIFAEHARNLNTDPSGDFCSEVRDYFGTGTQLQEMYITPRLFSRQNWDDLAEAARWSRSNADTLVDTHWIGGDPAHLEPYGWASWSARKGIITLRNPGEKRQAFSLDVQQAWELPPHAPVAYSASSPWQEHTSRPAVALHAGKPVELSLAPFEVLTLHAEVPRITQR